MKVKAIEPGYYNHFRRAVGAEFELNKEADFSAKWMEKVSSKESTKEEVKTGIPTMTKHVNADSKPVSLSEAGKSKE